MNNLSKSYQPVYKDQVYINPYDMSNNELNDMCAKQVMGWRRGTIDLYTSWVDSKGKQKYWVSAWNPTKRDDHCMEVIQKLLLNGISCRMLASGEDKSKVILEFGEEFISSEGQKLHRNVVIASIFLANTIAIK